MEDQFYDYPDRPVPADKRRTQLNIAVVTTGMAVAMSTLYTGSALAEVMSYKDGIISILAGCVINWIRQNVDFPIEKMRLWTCGWIHVRR